MFGKGRIQLKLLYGLAALLFILAAVSCDFPTHTINGEIETFTNTQPPYRVDREGSERTPVHLVNNPAAVNPTWSWLITFLDADRTDEIPYSESWKCGNYAEQLHNKAEAGYIRAAFVALELQDQDIGHALNAFETTDRGLVFIDAGGPDSNKTTGGSRMRLVTRNPARIEIMPVPVNWDKIAYIEINREYGVISLASAKSPEYSYFEKWKESYEKYLQTLKSLPGTIVRGSKQEAEALAIKSELQKLGPYWESNDTVTHINIYW
jgi:hypothetical protein